MLSVIHAECHMEVIYAECRYAECRYAECHGTPFKFSVMFAGNEGAYPSGTPFRCFPLGMQTLH
jgi:hypothetical protein